MNIEKPQPLLKKMQEFIQELKEKFQLSQQKQLKRMCQKMIRTIDLSYHDERLFNKILKHPLFIENPNLRISGTLYADPYPNGEFKLKHGTLLHLAALTSNFEMGNALLAKGVDPDLTDDNGLRAGNILLFLDKTTPEQKQFWRGLFDGNFQRPKSRGGSINV